MATVMQTTVMVETDKDVNDESEAPEAHGVDVGDGDNVDEEEGEEYDGVNAGRLEPKQRVDERRAGQPKNIYCHLCGQPKAIKTFRTTHLKVCRRMWREDENSTIKALISRGLISHDCKGRPFPPEPMLPQLNSDELKAPDETITDEELFYINELARHIWKTHAQFPCPYCKRGFNHSVYLKHAMGCHPVQKAIHFGRRDHTFRSVEESITKSYKVPHHVNDAPVSRPETKVTRHGGGWQGGPKDGSVELGPDGIPLYLNRENINRMRGVPTTAALSKSYNQLTKSLEAKKTNPFSQGSSNYEGIDARNKKDEGQRNEVDGDGKDSEQDYKHGNVANSTISLRYSVDISRDRLRESMMTCDDTGLKKGMSQKSLSYLEDASKGGKVKVPHRFLEKKEVGDSVSMMGGAGAGLNSSNMYVLDNNMRLRESTVEDSFENNYTKEKERGSLEGTSSLFHSNLDVTKWNTGAVTLSRDYGGEDNTHVESRNYEGNNGVNAGHASKSSPLTDQEQAVLRSSIIKQPWVPGGSTAHNRGHFEGGSHFDDELDEEGYPISSSPTSRRSRSKQSGRNHRLNQSSNLRNPIRATSPKRYQNRGHISGGNPTQQGLHKSHQLYDWSNGVDGEEDYGNNNATQSRSRRNIEKRRESRNSRNKPWAQSKSQSNLSSSQLQGTKSGGNHDHSRHGNQTQTQRKLSVSSTNQNRSKALTSGHGGGGANQLRQSLVEGSLDIEQALAVIADQVKKLQGGGGSNSNYDKSQATTVDSNNMNVNFSRSPHNASKESSWKGERTSFNQHQPFDSSNITSPPPPLQSKYLKSTNQQSPPPAPPLVSRDGTSSMYESNKPANLSLEKNFGNEDRYAQDNDVSPVVELRPSRARLLEKERRSAFSSSLDMSLQPVKGSYRTY